MDWSSLKALEVKPSKPTQMCVVLHGYGANAADLFSLHQMIQFGKSTHWIFPDGILDLGQAWSRAWFPIDVTALEIALQRGTHRDFSADSSQEFRHASDLLFEALDQSFSDYEKIFLAGFSQGAMLATDLALRDARVSKLIAFSSNLVDETRTYELAQQRGRKLEFFQSHGRFDPLLSLTGAKKLFETLERNGHRGIFHEFSGGHEIPQNVLNSVNEWIQNE